MPIGIHVDDTRDLTTLDCFGKVFFDDFVEAMLIIFEKINIKHTRKLFCDMRNVDYLDLSPYQLDRLADLYVSKSSGEQAAILSPTMPLFHLSMAFERRVPEDKRNFKIFQSVDDSEKWIESGTI